MQKAFFKYAFWHARLFRLLCGHRVMTTEIAERSHRMIENGATQHQVANVIGVYAKIIYQYFSVNS